MSEQIKNSAAATLAANIGAGDATLSVTTGQGANFPASGNFRLIVDSEIMLCTARSGDTLTVTRGQEGTSAASHTSGASVTHILTAGGLSQYISDQIVANRSLYRKTTSKQVVNTVTETDLLNGEITIGSGVMVTTSLLRLTVWGDLCNNTGATQAFPRFRLKLGGSTLIDTNAMANMNSSTTRYPWRFSVEIMNLGSLSSQWSSMLGHLSALTNGTTVQTFATGEGLSSFAASVGNAAVAVYEGGNTGAVDTSLSNALVFSVINGVANAGYDITLKAAIVEVV